MAVCAQSQTEPVRVLDTVYLSDANLKTFNTGQKQLRISDSTIARQNFSLTDLLQRQTPVYLRQNGYGMVSSASFRGTTASQTAVLWNGVNINSSLTGQTDFNTLLTANFSSIDVKFGGGSILYGTGAIGGSVHLNQNLSKNVEEQHQFQSAYGSFNTFETRYAYQNQFDDLKFKLAFARRQSNNDFDIPSQDRQNQNGQFEMNSLDAVVRLDIDDDNVLSYFSNFSFGERNFSVIRPTDPQTKYDNVDTRNMIEWQSTSDKIQSKLKLAYLTEQFTFFDNLSRNSSSSSEVATQWIQYELMYNLNAMKIKAILNYQNAQAEGNQLAIAERDVAGVSFLFQHQLTDQWNYELTLRQDVNDDFENPFLFSVGSRYQFNERWSLRGHASRNYRLPTFNDLFWANGGNPNLTPETAYQAEVGGMYDYQDFRISLTGFYNDITNMIRWLPDNTGIWRPQNTDEVMTYGLETSVNYTYQIADQQSVVFNTNFSYTVSEDQNTGNQLIYVPFYLANANATYRLDRWDFGLSWLYNGSVFTQTNNNPDRKVEAFNLFDMQISRRFPKLLNSRLSLRTSNLFDLAYEAVDNRPMPGRAFSIQLLTIF